MESFHNFGLLNNTEWIRRIFSSEAFEIFFKNCLQNLLNLINYFVASICKHVKQVVFNTGILKSLQFVYLYTLVHILFLYLCVPVFVIKQFNIHSILKTAQI